MQEVRAVPAGSGMKSAVRIGMSHTFHAASWSRLQSIDCTTARGLQADRACPLGAHYGLETVLFPQPPSAHPRTVASGAAATPASSPLPGAAAEKHMCCTAAHRLEVVLSTRAPSLLSGCRCMLQLVQTRPPRQMRHSRGTERGCCPELGLGRATSAGRRPPGSNVALNAPGRHPSI
jgi:hypothetical protein